MPRAIEGQYFLFRQRLVEVELEVMDEELAGLKAAEDTEGPPVEEPLGPHAESNGSHAKVPPG